MIDQLVAQWHSEQCGLGEIFEAGKTKTALRAIYENNYVEHARDLFNPWRLYAIDDEGGAIMCSWKNSSTKPFVPLTYNTEMMTGFEYQVASHMLHAGLRDEGLTLVNSIRRRYAGHNRNPWNEMECGSNYARSMASYSLLTILSGFTYDMRCNLIGFNPIGPETDFNSFWSLSTAWGNVTIQEKLVQITVLYGYITLSQIRLPWESGIVNAFVSEMSINNINVSDGIAKFGSAVTLCQGEYLKLERVL